MSMIDSGLRAGRFCQGLEVVVKDAGTGLPSLPKINHNNLWSRLNKTGSSL
jgi:hypothetical protein